MLQKIKNKLVGWWICLITKFLKQSSEKQYAIYAVIFILPMFLGYVFSWSFNAFLFLYYLVFYLFFQFGFIMVKK